MSRSGFVVAVDGPAASGKGVISRRLAAHLRLPVLDTGLLYRAVGSAMLRRGLNLDDPRIAARVARALAADDMTPEALRSVEVGEAASRVAVHPGVRDALVAFQRAFAAQPSGAVLDGRDIATVIWPAAPVKFFFTATPEARALRRWRQLADQGQVVSYEETLADLRRRDARDAARDSAPLRRADDAHLLDTTDLDIDHVFDVVRRIAERARARWNAADAARLG